MIPAGRLFAHVVSPLLPLPPLRSPVSLFVFPRRLCASAVNVVVRQRPYRCRLDAGRFSYDGSVPARFLPVTPGDVDRVVAMMQQLYAYGSPPFDATRARRATETLLTEPEFGGVWTIDVDGALAGYIVVLLGYSLEFGGRFGLLDELFVAETHRGGGLGAEALAFAGEQCRARGWQALRLEVGQENRRAIALYRRSGFQMHDRFLMTKWI